MEPTEAALGLEEGVGSPTPRSPSTNSDSDLETINTEELVIFHPPQETRTNRRDMEVTFTCGPAVHSSPRDWIGLFHSGWHEPKDFSAYQWVKAETAEKGQAGERVTFPCVDLRSLLGDFQLSYVTGDNEVIGVSEVFRIADSDDPSPSSSPVPSENDGSASSMSVISLGSLLSLSSLPSLSSSDEEVFVASGQQLRPLPGRAAAKGGVSSDPGFPQSPGSVVRDCWTLSDLSVGGLLDSLQDKLVVAETFDPQAYLQEYDTAQLFSESPGEISKLLIEEIDASDIDNAEVRPVVDTKESLSVVKYNAGLNQFPLVKAPSDDSFPRFWKENFIRFCLNLYHQRSVGCKEVLPIFSTNFRAEHLCFDNYKLLFDDFERFPCKDLLPLNIGKNFQEKFRRQKSHILNVSALQPSTEAYTTKSAGTVETFWVNKKGGRKSRRKSKDVVRLDSNGNPVLMKAEVHSYSKCRAKITDEADTPETKSTGEAASEPEAGKSVSKAESNRRRKRSVKKSKTQRKKRLGDAMLKEALSQLASSGFEPDPLEDAEFFSPSTSKKNLLTEFTAKRKAKLSCSSGNNQTDPTFTPSETPRSFPKDNLTPPTSKYNSELSSTSQSSSVSGSQSSVAGPTVRGKGDLSSKSQDGSSSKRRAGSCHKRPHQIQTPAVVSKQAKRRRLNGEESSLAGAFPYPTEDDEGYRSRDEDDAAALLSDSRERTELLQQALVEALKNNADLRLELRNQHAEKEPNQPLEAAEKNRNSTASKTTAVEQKDCPSQCDPQATKIKSTNTVKEKKCHAASNTAVVSKKSTPSQCRKTKTTAKAVNTKAPTTAHAASNTTGVTTTSQVSQCQPADPHPEASSQSSASQETHNLGKMRETASSPDEDKSCGESASSVKSEERKKSAQQQKKKKTSNKQLSTTTTKSASDDKLPQSQQQNVSLLSNSLDVVREASVGNTAAPTSPPTHNQPTTCLPVRETASDTTDTCPRGWSKVASKRIRRIRRLIAKKREEMDGLKRTAENLQHRTQVLEAQLTSARSQLSAETSKRAVTERELAELRSKFWAVLASRRFNPWTEATVPKKELVPKELNPFTEKQPEPENKAKSDDDADEPAPERKDASKAALCPAPVKVTSTVTSERQLPLGSADESEEQFPPMTIEFTASETPREITQRASVRQARSPATGKVKAAQPDLLTSALAMKSESEDAGSKGRAVKKAASGTISFRKFLLPAMTAIAETFGSAKCMRRAPCPEDSDASPTSVIPSKPSSSSSSAAQSPKWTSTPSSSSGAVAKVTVSISTTVPSSTKSSSAKQPKGEGKSRVRRKSKTTKSEHSRVPCRESKPDSSANNGSPTALLTPRRSRKTDTEMIRKSHSPGVDAAPKMDPAEKKAKHSENEKFSGTSSASDWSATEATSSEEKHLEFGSLAMSSAGAIPTRHNPSAEDNNGTKTTETTLDGEAVPEWHPIALRLPSTTTTNTSTSDAATPATDVSEDVLSWCYFYALQPSRREEQEKDNGNNSSGGESVPEWRPTAISLPPTTPSTSHAAAPGTDVSGSHHTPWHKQPAKRSCGKSAGKGRPLSYADIAANKVLRNQMAHKVTAQRKLNTRVDNSSRPMPRHNTALDEPDDPFQRSNVVSRPPRALHYDFVKTYTEALSRKERQSQGQDRGGRRVQGQGQTRCGTCGVTFGPTVDRYLVDEHIHFHHAFPE